MPNQWNTPQYHDGDMTICVSVGPPVFQAPIPLTTAKYVFTQEWQSPIDYAAVALNTAHPSSGLTPDYSSYLLVSEGPRREIGGDQVRFTRTYAQVPTSYMLPETFVYSFIGTLTSVGSPATLITRVRQSWPVESMVVHDYIKVPNASYVDPLTGTTYAITTAGDIAIVREMVYVYQNTITGGTAIAGGITMQTEILNPAGSTLPTWPTSDQYNAMVSDALSNRWAGTKTSVVLYPTTNYAGGPPPTSGHNAGAIDLVSTPHSVLGGLIPAEPSRLDIWMGSIFVRRTRYVLAQ